MAEVQRYDFARLDGIERTPSGGLRIPANTTRTGVLVYKFADGSVRRELRLPEHVFQVDSIKSLRDAPVTDLHPPEMVKPENYQKYAKGHVSDVSPKRNEGLMGATLAVQDADLIQKIDAKERQEISCGYRCDLLDQSGEYNGEKYDAIQTNIRYNHVAIGPSNWGRAGSTVALRLDSCDAFSEPYVGQESRKQENMTRTIRLDGADYEFGSDAHIAKLDSMHNEVVKAMQSQLDTANGRVDALTSDLTQVKAKLVTAEDPKRLDAAIAARVKLETDARQLLGPDEKLDGLTEREVMIAALRLDAKSVEGRSDDYIRGRFDIAISDNPTRTDDRSVRHALKVAEGGEPPARRQDGETDRVDADNARRKNRQDQYKRGTEPLPGAVTK